LELTISQQITSHPQQYVFQFLEQNTQSNEEQVNHQRKKPKMPNLLKRIFIILYTYML
jgi:hypothetical protein